MGYTGKSYGIYCSIGYIKPKLRDVLGIIMGYMWHKLWDILAKTIEYLRINYGIYWAKTIGSFMGYILPKPTQYIWQNTGI